MSWKVNDQEFRAVLGLAAPARYEYFVKRAAGHGELWGLRGSRGWVIAEDDKGQQHFPVWPHPRYAEACADGPWQGEQPAAIDIDEWVEGWLPDLERDGIRVAVFQTPADQGIAVAPGRLQRDLEEELSQFDL